MVLLRRVIGDALRARRQGQHRTLREVSTAANVSLGYLSEIERGQKEASSELLASICGALGAQLSDVLRQVSDTLAMAEEVEGALVPVQGVGVPGSNGADQPTERVEQPVATEPAEELEPVGSAPAGQPTASLRLPYHELRRRPASSVRPVEGGRMLEVGAGHAIRLPEPAEPAQRGGDGEVAVSVRHDAPLRTTLRTTRSPRSTDLDRDPVLVA